MGDNVGGLSEATVRAAYERLSSNEAASSTLIIVSALAIIFMISKLITIYSKSKTNEGFDRRVFFDMLKLYAKYAVFIAAFPFIISGFETGLAEVQDNLKAKYNTSLEVAGTETIAKVIEQYVEEEFLPEEDETWWEQGLDYVNQTVNPIKRLSMQIDALALSCFSASLYLLKYIYFFFCCGRYLWLMMLQILAPIALVLALNEKTYSYFLSWAKNMLICYLLIPLFLLADMFSETIIKVVCESADIRQYGLLAVIGMVVIKVGLFGYVSKKAYGLL